MERRNTESQNVFDYSGFPELGDGHTPVTRPYNEEIRILGLPAKGVIAEALHTSLSAESFRELPETLTMERIAEAVEAVLAIRVLQVRGTWVRNVEGMHFKDLRYPAFLWPIIRTVGDIENFSDGFTYRVHLDGEMRRFCEEGANGKIRASETYDWRSVRRTLYDIEAYGLKTGLRMATALPKDRTGCTEGLSFIVAEGRLESHTGISLMRTR